MRVSFLKLMDYKSVRMTKLKQMKVSCGPVVKQCYVYSLLWLVCIDVCMCAPHTTPAHSTASQQTHCHTNLLSHIRDCLASFTTHYETFVTLENDEITDQVLENICRSYAEGLQCLHYTFLTCPPDDEHLDYLEVNLPDPRVMLPLCFGEQDQSTTRDAPAAPLLDMAQGTTQPLVHLNDVESNIIKPNAMESEHLQTNTADENSDHSNNYIQSTDRDRQNEHSPSDTKHSTLNKPHKNTPSGRKHPVAQNSHTFVSSRAEQVAIDNNIKTSSDETHAPRFALKDTNSKINLNSENEILHYSNDVRPVDTNQLSDRQKSSNLISKRVSLSSKSKNNVAFSEFAFSKDCRTGHNCEEKEEKNSSPSVQHFFSSFICCICLLLVTKIFY